jgi:dienelactone hydrolase
MADLDAVIQWTTAHYTTNGRIGLIGGSYGGGQSLLGWTDDAKVTTAVAMYGWTDLQQALIPGNVPKLEWGNFLYFYGRAGTGDYDPMIDRWYQQTITRDDLATVAKEMQERSALPRMHDVTKPLLLCQGVEESLFPQIDTAWQNAGGFTRAVTYTGGHGSASQHCWDRALDWFRFFLAGYDTRVDAWPALDTVDADGTGPYTYASFPNATATSWRLRDSDLYQGDPTAATFTIRQYVVANPADAPSALWDQSGMPNPATPVGLRSDPSAVTFTTRPFDDGARLLGRSHLTLNVASGAPPFQVAATLYILRADGTSRSIAHGAAASLNATDAADGTLRIDFPWTHANIAQGEQLQLKLSANDPSWWMPLVANYQVQFDGKSELTLPFYPLNGA